jgi:hypothetical protein
VCEERSIKRRERGDLYTSLLPATPIRHLHSHAYQTSISSKHISMIIRIIILLSLYSPVISSHNPFPGRQTESPPHHISVVVVFLVPQTPPYPSRPSTRFLEVTLIPPPTSYVGRSLGGGKWRSLYTLSFTTKILALSQTRYSFVNETTLCRNFPLSPSSPLSPSPPPPVISSHNPFP